MSCRCGTTLLVASLGLLSPWVVVSQTSNAEASSNTVAAPVAHVYVQTTKGVNLYDANTAGQLSLVGGSPFANAGQMEGVNGGYLLSVGTDYLHAYKIETSGAVGPQASQSNTQSYGGSECGTTSDGGTPGSPNGAVLDHTGHNFYVQLYGTPGSGGVSAVCAAWQTYTVGTNGSVTFLGDIEYSGAEDHNASRSSIPTVSSSDKYAYGVFPEFAGFSTTAFSTFTRASNGEWQVNNSFTEKDPPTNPNLANGPYSYFPEQVQADSSGHLAVLLVNQSFQGCCGYYGPQQLASYTINSTTGGISSTNTYKNMPTPAFSSVTGMDMSPSGSVLALTGSTGLQFFHFNGAAPVTTFGSPLLTNVAIDQLGWDNNNHLYALSYGSGELYVYTVSNTSISPVSGSPYKVANAYGIKGLIVVPK